MSKLLKIAFFSLLVLMLFFLPSCDSNLLYFNESTPEKKASATPTLSEDQMVDKTQPPETTDQVLLFEVTDSMAVDNGVTSDAVFTLKDPRLITQIITYHWNSATGAEPGTISLKAKDGTIYGPWQASGSPGQNNVPNAYWNVFPNTVIPKGTYTIADSDPFTWSSNLNTNGVGMVYVFGKKP